MNQTMLYFRVSRAERLGFIIRLVTLSYSFYQQNTEFYENGSWQPSANPPNR